MNCESLNKLKGSALRQLYTEIMGHPPPPKASIHFLKGNIAWNTQAQQSGKDPNTLRHALLQQGKITAKRKKRSHKTGTRLVREWQGQVYEVTVLDQGFEYDGTIYRSLSEVANLITGSHCSGPRFFGLDKKA